jgi:hypothetical protein
MTLEMATSTRGAPLSPLALPTGATHRGHGRGVDVDAGQGDMLPGEQPSHAWGAFIWHK